MDFKNQKQKGQKQSRKTNVVESLKGIGDSVGKSIKNDLLTPTSEEFFNQIFGPKVQKKYSGEINAGESVEMGDVFSGRDEENQKLKAQISLERRLSAEEQNLVQKRSNELKVQLQALTSEVLKLANSTQNVSEEL